MEPTGKVESDVAHFVAAISLQHLLKLLSGPERPGLPADKARLRVKLLDERLEHGDRIDLVPVVGRAPWIDKRKAEDCLAIARKGQAAVIRRHAGRGRHQLSERPIRVGQAKIHSLAQAPHWNPSPAKEPLRKRPLDLNLVSFAGTV